MEIREGETVMNQRVKELLMVLKYGMRVPEHPAYEGAGAAKGAFRHPSLERLAEMKEEIRHQVSGATRAAGRDPVSGLEALTDHVQPLLHSYAEEWAGAEEVLARDLCGKIRGSRELAGLSGTEKEELREVLRREIRASAIWEEESLYERLMDRVKDLDQMFDENPYDETDVSLEDYASRMDSVGYRVGSRAHKEAAADAFDSYVGALAGVLSAMDDDGAGTVATRVMRGLLKDL